MRLAAGLVLAVVVLVGQPAVASRPDDPPRAMLRYRGDPIQRMRLMAWCWPGPNGGVGCGEADPMTWPRADTIEPGSRSRVRIHSNERPSRIFVDSYSSVRDNGRPRGRGEDIRPRRDRVVRDGKTVAWDIVFRLRSQRHHYVKVLLDYRKGTLVWNGHVRAF